MTREHTDSTDTRQRLLEAAGTLFATCGFHATTTLEICRLATANSAAVNYHFQTKENLYVHVWRHAFERSLAAHPPDGGVPASASAEKRLKGRIRALVERMLDPQSIDFDIAGMEMVNPTGLLCEVIHRCVAPLREGITRHVRDLLGQDISEQTVALCMMSINAQCFAPLHHERRQRSAPSETGRPPPPWTGIEAASLADHIFRFSLAGIRAMRRQTLHRQVNRKGPQ